jgi:hypothetical protein
MLSKRRLPSSLLCVGSAVSDYFQISSVFIAMDRGYFSEMMSRWAPLFSVIEGLELATKELASSQKRQRKAAKIREYLAAAKEKQEEATKSADSLRIQRERPISPPTESSVESHEAPFESSHIEVGGKTAPRNPAFEAVKKRTNGQKKPKAAAVNGHLKTSTQSEKEEIVSFDRYSLMQKDPTGFFALHIMEAEDAKMCAQSDAHARFRWLLDDTISIDSKDFYQLCVIFNLRPGNVETMKQFQQLASSLRMKMMTVDGGTKFVSTTKGVSFMDVLHKPHASSKISRKGMWRILDKRGFHPYTFVVVSSKH